MIVVYKLIVVLSQTSIYGILNGSPGVNTLLGYGDPSVRIGIQKSNIFLGFFWS